MNAISSIHNPKIQWVRKLLGRGQARQEESAFVVEGVRLAEEALAAGWKPRLVLYSSDLSARGLALLPAFQEAGAELELVDSQLMRRISETHTPQGILAVLPLRTLALPESLHFLLVVDGVRDPGNLGSILRTAAAAGVQALLLPPGSADAYAPKVVRAAMGAHFRLPIQKLEWTQIEHILKPAGLPRYLKVYLADAGAGLAYTQADLRAPLALIIGGEAAGAGMISQGLADDRLHIPMPGGMESLNAAIAAAVLLFEIVRQRTCETI